jgi:nucleoside-diphosphate-sugar epimerase
VRIAVTGASGFVGGAVARWLAERGHTVFSYGRRAPSALPAPLPNYSVWDVTAAPPTPVPVDAAVHCAAHVGQWGDEGEYRRINVEGTRLVLERFRDGGRFVHVSTSSVYRSDLSKAGLREDAPIGGAGLTAYARTKAEAEGLVRGSGVSAIILRPHIVYGPGDTTLWPRVVAARRLGWLPVPGDGRNRVSVTHVLNLAHAVECALSAPRASGTFNVTDGEDVSVDTLLRTMLSRHGLSARIAYVPRGVAWALAQTSERLWCAVGAVREPRLTRYVVQNLADECTLDIARAREELGYTPRWTYRDGPLTDLAAPEGTGR